MCILLWLLNDRMGYYNLQSEWNICQILHETKTWLYDDEKKTKLYNGYKNSIKIKQPLFLLSS